jgi:hypothetical protein
LSKKTFGRRKINIKKLLSLESTTNKNTLRGRGETVASKSTTQRSGKDLKK